MHDVLPEVPTNASPLTPDQREQLARQLLPAVKRLVADRCAKEPTLDWDEAFSEGLLALTRALNNWQQGDTPFRMFAWVCVRNAVADAARRASGTHLYRRPDRPVTGEVTASGLLLEKLQARASDPVEVLEPEEEEELPPWTECLTEDDWELIKCLDEGEGHKTRARRLGLSVGASRRRVERLRAKVGLAIEGEQDGVDDHDADRVSVEDAVPAPGNGAVAEATGAATGGGAPGAA